VSDRVRARVRVRVRVRVNDRVWVRVGDNNLRWCLLEIRHVPVTTSGLRVRGQQANFFTVQM
jgi:hypothetical protein